MISNKALIILCIFTLGYLPSWSQQISIPNDAETYSEYLGKLIDNTKNTFLINQWTKVDSSMKSTYNDQTNENIIALSKAMAARGHKLTEFQQLFILINKIQYSQKLNETDLKDLLAYLALAARDYPSRDVSDTFKSLATFFDNQIIYNGKFNQLYIYPEKFKFSYSAKKRDFFNKEEEVIEKKEEKSIEEDFGLFDVWDTEEQEEDPWDNPALEIKVNDFGKLVSLPLVKDLLLEVENATLVIVTPSDSLILNNTTGAFDMFAQNYVGNGGLVDWANVEIPDASVSLEKFSFKYSNPQIKAEEATLTYESYLKAPVKGVFEMKGEQRKNSQLSSYPRFKSYKNDAEFAKLDVNIEYQGGFSLVGNRIFSTALFDNLSTLYVNRGKQNNFKVTGRRFEFTDSLITSKQISFVTYLGEDSISHPALTLRYETETKDLTLQKVAEGGFRNSMYSDTFHEMDIRCDAMKWNLNNGKMDFLIIAGKSEIPAVFESFNYYNPDRLRSLSTIAGWNPLMYLGSYVYRKRKNEFTLYEIYSKLSKDPIQIKNGVVIAMQMGFIDYDPTKDSYSLSRKGIHYFKSANGSTDYDDLVLASVSPGGGQNASLDRNSNSLDFSGTQEFKLSDSLGIRFLPKDKSMKLEGSNTFKFSGEIIVKNYRIVGDFDVDYDNFKVDLKRIDSIAFIPIDLYKKGSKIEIGGHVQFASKGTLYLNAPNNKSGRKKLEEYPKLEIPEGATVYFNNPNRDYKYSERVVFKIPKISQDSLNSVDFAYEGQFYSGGIIKPITETLTYMPDTSIGFVHNPIGAYELYGTNSNFTFSEPLKMTKKGLLAKGTLQHIASTLEIEQAFLFDSSMISKGPKASIKEQLTKSNVYYPQVAINAFKSEWKPSADSLTIASSEVLDFYRGTSKLTGSLLVRQSGLFGKGLLDRQDSETASDKFKFDKDGFLASGSKFTIKAAMVDAKPALMGENVSVEFNVVNSFANISPEDVNFNDTLSSSIAFPNAEYSTTIDNANWDIKNQKITMKGELEKSRFLATNKDQFKLAFNGTGALYDIKANFLNVTGVQGVNSVDAIIVPKDGEVIIRGGKVEPLVNAKVIADTLNKYHVLTEANITINSKLSFTGNASYQFVNVSSDTFNIKMGEFSFSEVNAAGEVLSLKKSEKLSTIANAKVTIEDSVFLSPKIIYRGDITMLAPFKNLNLKGQVRPELDKYPFLGGNWINYSGNKSESIQINVDNTLKDGGKPLFAGLHLQGTTSADALYPTFLSAKRYEYDHNIFLANGLFQRDEENKRFVIESTTKSGDTDRYELYDDQGIIRMEGNLKLLQEDFAKEVQTVGIATVLLDSLSYEFNTMMKYNFPIAPPLLQKMGQNIVKTNLDIGVSESAIAFESDEFKTKLAKFVGSKGVENFSEQYLKGHVPLFKFSPKFFATIMFTDLQLAWNPVANSFHNQGRLGISNIGETDINAMMNGYFEIVKNNSTGDEIYLFLEVSSSEWYYLGYKNGQMGVVSSDFELNQALVSKEKSKGAKDYEVIPVDLKEAMDYRKRFLMTYLGASEDDFKKTSISSSPTTLKKVVTPETKAATPNTKPVEAEEEDGF